MPDEKTDRYDGFLSFEAGVNTNIAPYLLPKNQLGAAVNATMRGMFVKPRSPYQQISLSTPIPQGLYQGATYYKPDSGLESIVLQCGGRLFEIIPSPTAPTAAVNEITIPNDPNPSANTQAWLWQSESWVVVDDGVSIPIFYTRTPSAPDPNTRRAQQYQAAIYSVPGGFLAPGQGNTVEVTLSQQYTQGPNYPVYVAASAPSTTPTTDLFTAAPATGAILTLTNVTDVAGKTVKGGANIYQNNAFLGFIYKEQVISGPNFGPDDNLNYYTVQLTLVPAYPPSAGSPETIIEANYTVLAGAHFYPPAVGSPYYSAPNNGNVVVATTLKSSSGQFISPSKGSTVTVNIQQAYQGQVGQDVFIGTGIYLVTAIENNLSNVVILTQTSSSPVAANPYAAGIELWPVQGGAELPPGRMGCYGMGQNFFSFPNGISFASGDIVGSSSGTPAYNFRDAVLKFTQNSYLSTGGTFAVPGAIGKIQAMAFISNLDVSLGQGPLQVATPNVVFSSASQITLEASGGTWASVTNPILTESLIANGSVSQWSTVTANGDLMFRSPDGYRSLILGRRDFNTWGNVPISVEMQQYIQNDNPALLNFASAIIFDNRMLATVGPTQAPFGVYNTGMVVLNFDPISSLRGKQPSIWEGLWQDLNVLQLVTGSFSGTPRAFALTYNTTTNLVELWEILPFTATSAVPITTTLEFPVCAFGETDPRQREWKKLEDGELAFDQIVGQVSVSAFYRTDYDSNYRPWSSFTIPASPNYQPRCGLDKPPKAYDPSPAQGGTGRYYSFGFHFQIKLVIVGIGWRLMAGRFLASKQPQAQFPPMLPKVPPS